MSWFDAARARLRLLLARRAAESRIDEEIAFHIEMERERLVREEGIAREEAHRRALVTFGGVAQHRETLREGRGLAWLGGLSLDAKLAMRMLIKHPALTIVAVVGMAVAVAIGAVSFSAIDAIAESELPFSEGDRVIAIRNIDTRSLTDARLTHLHDLATWREALTTVEELGAYRMIDRNLVAGDARAEPVRVAEMTASGFRIARVPPLLGRYFRDDDERAGAPPVVIIGRDIWRTRFAESRDIIGRTIQLGAVRHTIIGVMPEGFAFPVNNRVWTPLRLDPNEYERGRAPAIEVFGRLAPGASIADARRQAETIGRRLAAEYPRTHGSIRPRVVGYTRMFIDNPEQPWLYHLGQLLITMLLVVIGTNVAVLVYARTASRTGEIAVRTALGASRARIVGQLFAEALALSGIATAVGLVVAYVALRNIDDAVRRISADGLPFWLRFHITPGVLVYCAALAVLGAVIVGVVPALKATSRRVSARLQQIGAGGSGMRLGRAWTFLIIAQVTLAVAVLPLAIAGVAAWTRFESAKSKLATKGMLTATLSVDQPESADGRAATRDSATDSARVVREAAARSLALRAELVRRLEAEPGVTDVVFGSSAPAAEPSARIEVEPESVRASAPVARDDTLAAASPGAMVNVARTDLRWFDALGVPILAGRAFQAGDLTPATTVVIVNRSFARKLLQGANPLGRRIRTARREGARGDSTPAAPWEEIVGVVPDFPVDSSTPVPRLYRPLSPTEAGPVTIGVRLRGTAPAPFANRLRAIALATSPALRLDEVETLDQTLADEYAPTRLAIVVMELVTASTVLLAAAGIYALVAFTITRRRREIGIRAALGAGPRRVLVSVLSRVAGQMAVGIVIGIALAGTFDRLLQGGYTGRRAAFALPAVAAFMAIVGLLAAIGPARRALRIEPTEALKSE
jgi:predicted permease